MENIIEQSRELKVGDRLLLRLNSHSVFSITVIEISPNGDYIKAENDSETIMWIKHEEIVESFIEWLN
jgi:hypothetical protein